MPQRRNQEQNSATSSWWREPESHAPLTIRLLGKFQVSRGDQAIPDAAWARRNARTLFKFLVLSPGRRCHKEQALELLWPDLDPQAAANNLRKTLYYLRRILCGADGEGRDCPYVEFDGETLALAAVMGREFPYPWLLAAGTWEEGQLLDQLDEALQVRILEEVSQRSGPVLYRFHHGLIRQALYDRLSEARRRHLHSRVAAALEGLPDAPFSFLSHHWFAVGRWSWAFCHALTAADRARQAFANAEALSLYDRALAAARHDWQTSAELLARVHAGRAQALMGLARPADAVADLEWLAEAARQSGNRVAYGQAVSRLATAHFWSHNLEAARRRAQEALAVAEETGDRVTATMCTSNLGCIALSTGQLDQGIQHLETVLREVRAFGEAGTLVEALACLPGGYHWQGESERSLPLLEEGINLAQREGISFWLGNLLFFAGLAHGSLCHYEQALEYFRWGQRHSQESGDMFTAIRVANSMGWIHFELFDLQNAVAYDRQGVEMARGFPWPEPLAHALAAGAWLAGPGPQRSGGRGGTGPPGPFPRGRDDSPQESSPCASAAGGDRAGRGRGGPGGGGSAAGGRPGLRGEQSPPALAKPGGAGARNSRGAMSGPRPRPGRARRSPFTRSPPACTMRRCGAAS